MKQRSQYDMSCSARWQFPHSESASTAEMMTGGNYIVGAALIGGGLGSGAISKAPVLIWKTDLKTAHCFPNPYKPNSAGDFNAAKIVFSELTRDVSLKVYNVAGELVYDQNAVTAKDVTGGTLDWNAVNNKGQKLASGVYIYLLTNASGQKKEGKVAIIK